MGLKELSKQVPYKWKIQSYNKTSPSVSCVAYIDARDVMNILDEEIGPENWQSDYKEIKGNLYAGIGIKVNNEWIWKWDCGIESKAEAEKGESSDGFKRAAVKWGVGRFLYSLDIQWLKTNEVKTSNNYPHPIDEKGNKIKDISEYINNKYKPVSKVMAFSNIQKTKAIDNLKTKLAAATNHSEIELIRTMFFEYCGKNNIDVSFTSVESIFKEFETKLQGNFTNTN